MPLAARIRAAALPGFAEALQLAEAEGATESRQWVDEHTALAARPGGLAPAPLVTGSDLIQRGRRPSPEFKPILDAAYDRQLEGPITDRDEALQALERHLRA